MQSTDDENTLDMRALAEHFSGTLVVPETEGYDQLKQVFAKTGRPALIAQCQSEEDVQAVIAFARTSNRALSIRSGGHDPRGASTNVDGIVLDLSPMHVVKVIDEAENIVAVQGGATWGQVAATLAEYKLAITAGDMPSVGVGGLTLGGGIGWMARKFGLAIDSLQAVTIVTADGQIVRASLDEHADLFWAVRGGGGNFGVATLFEFKAQPVAGIYSGNVAYDVADIQKVITGWADYMRTAPEELTSIVTVLPQFGPNPASINIGLCYVGQDEQTAMQAINPLLQLATVVRQNIVPNTYSDLILGHSTPPTPPNLIRRITRNAFIKTFNVDVAQIISANFGKTGAPILQLRSLGGAMSTVAEDSTAFSHRDNEVILVAANFAFEYVPEHAALQQMDTAWKPLEQFATGMYVGFYDGEPKDTNLVYPPSTFARLLEVKKNYDPQNVFNQNYNITSK